jgi:hypothetical protein
LDAEDITNIANAMREQLSPDDLAALIAMLSPSPDQPTPPDQPTKHPSKTIEQLANTPAPAEEPKPKKARKRKAQASIFDAEARLVWRVCDDNSYCWTAAAGDGCYGVTRVAKGSWTAAYWMADGNEREIATETTRVKAQHRAELDWREQQAAKATKEGYDLMASGQFEISPLTGERTPKPPKLAWEHRDGDKWVAAKASHGREGVTYRVDAAGDKWIGRLYHDNGKTDAVEIGIAGCIAEAMVLCEQHYARCT